MNVITTTEIHMVAIAFIAMPIKASAHSKKIRKAATVKIEWSFLELERLQEYEYERSDSKTVLH